MSARGPATQSLDERIDGLAGEMRELSRGLGDLRTDLAKFQGGVERDLKWIKGIGASVLATIIAGGAWVIRESTTLKDEVKHQETRLEKVEKRLDGIDAKLELLIRRTEPKGGG